MKRSVSLRVARAQILHTQEDEGACGSLGRRVGGGGEVSAGRSGMCDCSKRITAPAAIKTDTTSACPLADAM